MYQSGKTVSVVIPTFNRRESLRRVLQALGEQTYPNGAYEVVVAIDGSEDGTREMLRSLSTPFRLRFAEQEHLGTAAARNLAVEMAEGEILLSLDDDIVAHPQLLAAHATCHLAHAKAVVLGQIPIHPQAELSVFARYRHRRFEHHYRKMNRPNYVPDFRDCLTGNMSLRAEHMRRAGGFDSAFREYNHEDTELGYRLQGLGLELHYLPSALGYHLYDKSFVEGCDDSYGEGRSSILMLRKHPRLDRFLPAGRRSNKSRSALVAQLFALSFPWDKEQLIRSLDWGMRVVAGARSRPLLYAYFSMALQVCYWRGVRDEDRAIPYAGRRSVGDLG